MSLLRWNLAKVSCVSTHPLPTIEGVPKYTVITSKIKQAGSRKQIKPGGGPKSKRNKRSTFTEQTNTLTMLTLGRKRGGYLDALLLLACLLLLAAAARSACCYCYAVAASSYCWLIKSVLWYQCCCCSAYTLLADTCDTDAAAVLLLNCSHPGNTTSQSLRADSTRQSCLRSREEISHSSVSSMPTCGPSCNNCGQLEGCKSTQESTGRACHSCHAGMQAKTLKFQSRSTQASQIRPWAICHMIDDLHWKSEVEFEFACHDIGTKIQVENKLNATNLTARFVRVNVCKWDWNRSRDWNRNSSAYACKFDFDSHSKSRRNSNDSPQLLSPESAPSRRPRQDVTALRAQQLPFWSYFLHTASGRPRQDSRMEDGRPNGGLTPPWAHQQSPDLPPGPPSSEHQILKVKVIWRPVIFLRYFHRPKIENLSGSKIFDPSQEDYLLISRNSNSELIAKRWRITVPAPGPVRVSPLWQPRWA